MHPGLVVSTLAVMEIHRYTNPVCRSYTNLIVLFIGPNSREEGATALDQGCEWLESFLTENFNRTLKEGIESNVKLFSYFFKKTSPSMKTLVHNLF